MSPASRLRLFRRDFTRRLTKLLKQPRRPELREHLPRRYSLRLLCQDTGRKWFGHYALCFEDCGRMEHHSPHCVDVRYWGEKGVMHRPASFHVGREVGSGVEIYSEHYAKSCV